MTSRRLVAFTCGAVFLALPAGAIQGVVVTERTTTNGTAGTQQVQLTPQRMRADIVGPDGRQQTVVFDGAKQVMYLIDTARKSYTEMTKADADQMGAQLSGAMAQMQQMMANMPPERRAQMEAMMAGRGLPGMAAPTKPQYAKGGSQKVGKWTCDTYTMSMNSQPVGELCTVDPKTLGFTPADFEVSRQLAAFFQALVPQGAGAMFQVGRMDDQGFSGVPVKRVMKLAGREMTSELQGVVRQDLPDSLFAVPEGFQKQAFPGMGGRGRAGRGQ
jgi:hypothetical protein